MEWPRGAPLRCRLCCPHWTSLSPAREPPPSAPTPFIIFQMLLALRLLLLGCQDRATRLTPTRHFPEPPLLTVLRSGPSPAGPWRGGALLA